MNKIKTSKEFDYIYKKNHKIYSKYVIILKSIEYHNETKFGFVASKKVGNAIKRNRIKRLMKETIRNNLSYFENNKNYIFIAKSRLKEELKNLKYKDIEKDMLKAITNEKNNYKNNRNISKTN